jgi:hypothetical protein
VKSSPGNLWKVARWIRRILSLKNMVWKNVQAVTAMDIFKIPNGSLVRNAGALGSSKEKRSKIMEIPIALTTSGRRHEG